MSKKPVLPQPVTFDWDSGNKQKNVIKHKVENSETEEIFENNPVIIFDESHSQLENRYLAYGISEKGRQLVVSFTLRGEKQEIVRPIMSRDQDKKEREYYKKERGG